jgi:hypothetical protein
MLSTTSRRKSWACGEVHLQSRILPTKTKDTSVLPSSSYTGPESYSWLPVSPTQPAQRSFPLLSHGYLGGQHNRMENSNTPTSSTTNFSHTLHINRDTRVTHSRMHAWSLRIRRIASYIFFLVSALFVCASECILSECIFIRLCFPKRGVWVDAME